MKTLKREVYNFVNKDYEKFDYVELTFNVQRVSIENFLNLGFRNYLIKYSKEYVNDNTRTWCDNKMKALTIKAPAYTMFELLEKLGFKRFSAIIENTINVRHSDLRNIEYYAEHPIYKVFTANKKIKYLFDFNGELLCKMINNKIVFQKQYSTFRRKQIVVTL